MIIPSNITQLDRTPQQKQEFLVFCVLCAGKSSEQQAQKLEQFRQGSLDYYNEPPGLFSYFQYLLQIGGRERLENELRKCKLGKYELCGASFSAMAEEPGCTEWYRDDLVSIPGISYKTASLYRMHAFGDRLACLDTHILRYLREKMNIDAPKQAPADKRKYEQFELIYLGHCYKQQVEPRTLDLEIWNKRQV